MNSQLLLLINFAIFAAVALWLFFGRSKGKQGPYLSLKDSNADDSRKLDNKQTQESTDMGDPKLSSTPAQKSVERDVTPREEIEKLISSGPPLTALSPKGKSVYFVYNGHEWEAHEVLGLKPGASLVEITEHYQKLIKSTETSTLDFYESAFMALVHKERK